MVTASAAISPLDDESIAKEQRAWVGVPPRLFTLVKDTLRVPGPRSGPRWPWYRSRTKQAIRHSGSPGEQGSSAALRDDAATTQDGIAFIARSRGRERAGGRHSIARIFANTLRVPLEVLFVVPEPSKRRPGRPSKAE